MNKSLELKSSHYQDIKEILEITVKTTRKILKCDRVVVYDASELPNVEVIAESVDTKYAASLGTTVFDPFLTGDYLELYCYGQAVIVNDLDSTDIESSQLKDLKRLNVKSLAIAPITFGNELLGLLVAHQCSPSDWHPHTSSLLIEKANTASYALSNIVRAQKTNLKAEQLPQPNEVPIMESKNNSNGKGNRNLLPTEEIKAVRSETFDQINERISNESGRENILNRAVEEARHLLKCDRVVVYSLNEDEYGVVVAESVAASWTTALGKMIDDPCIATNYIDEYRYGRVRVINNIHAGNVSPCYKEQLEELKVKANLVVPMVSEGELFGLLIAHQCSTPRNWQEQEIDWMSKIASKVGLLLEDSKVSTHTEPQPQASKNDQWNDRFTDAIQYIRQSLNREDILKASVKEVRRILECDRVVVYSLDRELRYGEVIAESVAPGWKQALNKHIEDPCFEPTYREKYLNGRVRAWNNIYEYGLTKCYIEQLEDLQVKANLVAPIISEGKLFGLLVAHQCSDFRNWQQPEIRWVSQIATQVGFALDNAKLLADARQLQQQLETEAKLTKYFTDAVGYIRESLDREDILETSVEEVRRVLNCDRVVVYSLDRELRYGAVIAESVAPGWTRALNKEIEDPCFEPTYRDKYRNGRVRAWNNIYEAGMNQCYIEQLEKLEVKANLVTPVVSQGKLFGLLVAHQCSDFRNWQQPEIRWVTQVASQVGFALDNAKLLTDAKQARQQVEDEKKWTDYFTDTTQHIRKSLKTDDILNTSVKEVRRVINCDRVLVYSLNSDNYGAIVAESVAPGWTRGKGRVIEDPCFENKYLDKYRNGRIRAWNNIYESGMTKCHIEQLEELEVKANLVAPIINEGKLFGLLAVQQCSDFRQWQQNEIRWVSQIATQIGLAIDNAKLIEQLQKSTETKSQISQQQQEHTKALKHQVVEILADNGDAYQTLSQSAMRQSETTINVLHQIQQVADSFNDVAIYVQQVQFKEQQKDLAVQETQVSLNHAVNNITNAENAVNNLAIGLNNLDRSSQKLYETVNTIKNLSRKIVKQSMNAVKIINRSQIDAESQNSVMDLSDTIFTLMQELFDASAKVEPLFNNIRTEVKERTMALESGTQQLTGSAGELQTVRQKLDRVVALNSKIDSLIENISHLVENQTQSSTFAKDSVQEVASIAEQISEQSMTITQSFDRLVVLVQKL